MVGGESVGRWHGRRVETVAESASEAGFWEGLGKPGSVIGA